MPTTVKTRTRTTIRVTRADPPTPVDIMSDPEKRVVAFTLPRSPPPVISRPFVSVIKTEEDDEEEEDDRSPVSAVEAPTVLVTLVSDHFVLMLAVCIVPV